MDGLRPRPGCRSGEAAGPFRTTSCHSEASPSGSRTSSTSKGCRPPQPPGCWRATSPPMLRLWPGCAARGRCFSARRRHRRFAYRAVTPGTSNPWDPGRIPGGRAVVPRLPWRRALPGGARHGHGWLDPDPRRPLRDRGPQAAAGVVSVEGVIPLAPSFGGGADGPDGGGCRRAVGGPVGPAGQPRWRPATWRSCLLRVSAARAGASGGVGLRTGPAGAQQDRRQRSGG